MAKNFAFGALFVGFLSVSAVGASCSGASCVAQQEEDAVTSLVQTRRNVNLGPDRSKKMNPVAGAEQHAQEEMAANMEDFKKSLDHSLQNMEEIASLPQLTKAKQPEKAQTQSKKPVTFVGKVGNEEWSFLFRKKSKKADLLAEAKPAKPEDVEDDSELYALSDDGLALAIGTDSQKAMGFWDGCPELGLDIPGCRWHAWANGYGWRHGGCPGLGLHLPGCTGWWDLHSMPTWRTKWEVAAALPVKKSTNITLAPTPKQIADSEDQIELQMKAANYEVAPADPAKALDASLAHKKTSETKLDTDKDDKLSETMLNASSVHKKTSEAKPDTDKDDKLSETMSKIVAAKTLFQRRLTEGAMHLKQFEVEQQTAEHSIHDAHARLHKVELFLHGGMKAFEKKKDMAKSLWARAASQMADAEGKGSVHKMSSEKIKKLKADAEKYAAEEMKRGLEMKLVAKDIQDGKEAVLKVTADDLVSDELTHKKLAEEGKYIEEEVRIMTAAEEDIIMEKVTSHKAATKSSNSSDSSLLALTSLDGPSDAVQQHTAEAAEETSIYTESDEVTVLEAAEEKSFNSESDEVTVLEDALDIADRTRMALYGVSEISELAVRVAAAKMAYQRTLYLEQLDGAGLARDKEFAEQTVKDGEKWLQKLAKDKVAAVKAGVKKISEARGQWEKLAGEMKKVAGEEGAEELKVTAEMKAEHELNMELMKEQAAYWKQKIGRRSAAENKARKGADDKEAETKANAEWKEIVKKVKEEMTKQEKVIESQGHKAKDTKKATKKDTDTKKHATKEAKDKAKAKEVDSALPLQSGI